MTDASLLAGRATWYERRREAGRKTKASLLARCRALMASGVFQPTAAEICGQGLSPQAVANHFGSLPALYEQAVDTDTARAIARRIMRRDCEDLMLLDDMRQLARAAVFGRIEP